MNRNTLETITPKKVLLKNAQDGYVIPCTEADFGGTTQNNTGIPLGFSVYCGMFLMPDSGWLKSLGQWNSGEVYKSFYDKALNKIGETFAGGFITDTTNTYTDFDLVLNTVNKTFRLPLRTAERVIVDKKEPDSQDAGWYKLYSDGWCEQGGYISCVSGENTLQFSKSWNDTHYYVNTSRRATSSTTGNVTSFVRNRQTNSCQIYTSGSIEYDWYACGYCSVPDITSYTEIIALYFKVANSTENEENIDVAEITNALSEKVDYSNLKEVVCITETYNSGTSWYRIYSDGWCEQGGTTGSISSGTKTTFLKQYLNTNYTFTMALLGSTARDSAPSAVKAIDGFTIYHAAGLNNGLGWSWQASGYIEV